MALFVFALATYALGVVTLAVLVLVTFGVLPFTGGPIGVLPLVPGLALDLALLVVFAVQHSVMARASFKARWTRIVPVAVERATYLLASVIALLPLVWLWQPAPLVIWSVQSAALRWLVLAIAVASWIYLLVATFAIDHFELFGLRQAYRALRGQPPSAPPFRVRWMYRFDRHPIMTGILVGTWATPTMTLDHLALAVGITVYIWIGVFFEERSLRRQLGEPYEDYCKHTRSIVPTFRVKLPPL